MDVVSDENVKGIYVNHVSKEFSVDDCIKDVSDIRSVPQGPISKHLLGEFGLFLRKRLEQIES